ncbi:MAG: SEL1-like repeat protein [Opitutaceae bacterium]|nr:SEL1-like repeat protein [Opitutaceae bacterium]
MAPAEDPLPAARALLAEIVSSFKRTSGTTANVAPTPEQAANFVRLEALLPKARSRYRDDFSARMKATDRQQQPGNTDLVAGYKAEQAGRRDEALAHYRRAAEAGNTLAMLGVEELLFAQAADATDPENDRGLSYLVRAAEAGDLRAMRQLLGRVFPDSSPDHSPELTRRWARPAAELGDPYAGYVNYFQLMRERRAKRLPTLSSSPEYAAEQKALVEALGFLRDAALRDETAAQFELASYHLYGGIPGLRTGDSNAHDKLNLPLAHFWFTRALAQQGNLSETTRQRARESLAVIERAYALAKGRPWKPDELLAALQEKLPQYALAYLVTRESAELYDADFTRLQAAAPPNTMPDFGLLARTLAVFTRAGGGNAIVEATDALIERHLASTSLRPAPELADTPELRARFAAGEAYAAYQLHQLLNSLHPFAWPATEPKPKDVFAQALSVDDPRTQWLRVSAEQLATHPDPAKRDPVRAVALLRAGAEAGEAEAAVQLAGLYTALGGERGVRRNYFEAERWYLHALAIARPGQRWSIGDLAPRAALYALYSARTPSIGGGISMSNSHTATAPWLAELRRRSAPFSEMVDLYFVETSSAARRATLKAEVEKLIPLADPYTEAELADLRRRADAGELPALLELADALAHGRRGLRPRDDLAHPLHRRAAEAGSPEGMRALADDFQHGYGVREDLLAAVEWRARAEGRRPPRAEMLVTAARLAAEDHDTHALVEPYLLEAVDLGSEDARHQLAYYLLQGRPLKKDPARALRLYTEAAEAGHAPAMASLAFAYGEGKDLPKDEAVSHRWRVRAAEAGDRGSRTLLAYYFNRGTNGAPLDKKQALHWARLVAPEDRSIRENLLPSLEREVAEATPTDHGAAAFARATSLTGDARLAALREAARHAHIEATARLMELLCEARLWHEAHWWATRSFMLKRDDSAKARALIEGQPDFHVAKLRKDEVFTSTPVDFSDAHDEPLEKSLPILAEALQRAGQDRRRLLAQLDQIIDRHADRAEPLIAKAQLTLDQPAAARELLDRAVKLAPAHPQAHALLARIEASAGQPYRAYYRLTEVRKARPDSLMLAAAQAELLHAIGGEAAERQKARHSMHYLLKRLPADYPPPDRFAALVAAAKLAAGMEAWAEADADLTAAFQLNRDPRLLLERAQVRERLKAYPGAIADYTAVLASPLAQNPQQAAQLRARIAAVRQAMDAETARLRDETAKIDAGLERVREANSPETRQRIGDRMGAAMDFVAGNRAHEAGDIAKARELWTKAAAAGHIEAAESLKTLPPPKP